MIFGRSVVFWVLMAFFAVCLFILAQWAIPLLFGFVDVTIPSKVVNRARSTHRDRRLLRRYTRGVVVG